MRANPDGHVRDWRYNYDPSADPEFGEKGKGYDINRYHNPASPPRTTRRPRPGTSSARTPSSGRTS